MFHRKTKRWDSTHWSHVHSCLCCDQGTMSLFVSSWNILSFAQPPSLGRQSQFLQRSCAPTRWRFYSLSEVLPSGTSLAICRCWSFWNMWNKVCYIWNIGPYSSAWARVQLQPCDQIPDSPCVVRATQVSQRTQIELTVSQRQSRGKKVKSWDSSAGCSQWLSGWCLGLCGIPTHSPRFQPHVGVCFQIRLLCTNC